MLLRVGWVRVCVWMCALGAGGRARELDPAACAARFDVQRDKIIRTEESREMGARYLSELDVGTRRECLRLCCETDGCDVFVFEEKSPGSCYLFKCGPPEDFRCKFTGHGNFSSGVLALSRHLAELQDQERLVPLHHQLADLSKSRSTSTSTPRAPPAPPHPPAPPDTQPPATGRCSRYQFECRVGGECIAVYNACDGVAQCADGSDEAPELGCPPARPPSPPPTPRPPPAATPGPPATPAPTPLPPAVPQVRVETDMEEGGGLSAAEAAAEAAELWPHRLTQAQPQHRYNAGLSNMVRSSAGGLSGAPHIFSHKGGLVQELGEGAFEPPAPAPALDWPRHVWQTPPHHNDLSIGIGAETIGSNIGIEGAEGEWVPRQAGGPAYWGDGARARLAHRLVPSTQQQAMYDTSVVSENAAGAAQSAGGKTMPELPLVYSGQPATLRDAPKKGFALAPQGAPAPAAPRPAPAPAAPPPPARPPLPTPSLPPAPAPTLLENTTKKKVLKDSEEEALNARNLAVHEERRLEGQPAPREQHEQWASDEHDGLSERPPAALLLLVLGTLMTAALGALAGCRLRAATRRRRHKRYALDADYLVNGMYL